MVAFMGLVIAPDPTAVANPWTAIATDPTMVVGGVAVGSRRRHGPYDGGPVHEDRDRSRGCRYFIDCLAAEDGGAKSVTNLTTVAPSWDTSFATVTLIAAVSSPPDQW
jgi:hypothetical protein